MKQVIYKTIKELVNNQDIQIIDGDRGKNYPKKEEFKSTGFCVFLNASNIKDDTFVFENIDFISEEKDNLLRKGKLSRNDIVITTRGTVGLVAYYGDNIPYDNMRINSGMIIIRVNSNVINPNYFYQLLKSKSLKKQYQLFASGCAQPQLPIQDFRLISIPVFTKTHQDKIAKILSNYDDLIENNNKRIKILEEMAQKIYKEWFVDFKFPNHETATFKQTELGDIPTNWEVANIEKYYNTSSGGTPSRKQFSYYDNGNINWIKTGELKNTFVIDTEEKITEKAIKNSSAKVFPTNTVTLAMYCGMGDISIMSKPMATNQACCVFLPKYDYLEYPFSYLFFCNITKEMINISFGAAQQNLSQEVIKAYIVKFPNKEILLDFNKIIKPVFENIKNLLYKNQTLKQMRDLLLPRLISGEIDVENMEIK